MLLALGYELLLIDHLRPGFLVETHAADAVQPEAVCDYLALVGRPERITSEWTIEPPFTLEDTVARLAVAAGDVAASHRRYSAELLAEGPAWLRDDPALEPALRALALDDSPAVRDAFATREQPGPGAAHAGACAPRRAEPLLRATGLVLPVWPGEAERAAGQPGTGPDAPRFDLVLAPGGRFTLPGGDPEKTSLLLRVLAGFATPLAGEVEAPPSTLLVAPGVALEPLLSVEENVAVFAAYAGCDVGEAAARAPELAEVAGAGHPAAPLADAGPGAEARLMLVLALAHVRPRALLVDALPPLAEPFAAWVRAATGELLASGAVVVEVTA
jgi:hypothetical protein